MNRGLVMAATVVSLGISTTGFSLQQPQEPHRQPGSWETAAIDAAENQSIEFVKNFKITPEAFEIHQSGMLWDGHNDLPWTMRASANSSFDKVDISKPTGFHTDIDRLRKGGVKAQFWSVFVPVSTMAEGNAHITTIEQIDLVNKMCQRYPDVFEIALSADDVERIVASGKIASLIGVEGGHSIENSLGRLRELYERGARYMTLTHSRNLDWADACTDEPRAGGLNEFGEEVVREMNRLGMLVDLAHVSPECMRKALAVTRAPVIFSHSSAKAICDHPRNVPDDVLQLTARNGGVVMVNFFTGFLLPKNITDVRPDALGDLRVIVDHIDHIVAVAGIDHVGLGSDYDGVPRVPRGCEDVSTYPALTQELLDRGYNRDDIHKILGGNILRVLRQTEAVSRQIRDEK
jgi:membrane dipeptidase